MSPFLRALWVITVKDLRVEARAREVVYAMTFFSALVVLLFAFAFTREGVADANSVAGVLWIAIALAGTLGLSRATDREREGGTIRALLLAPVDRSAIYAGKLLATVLFMLLAELVTVPLVALFFNVPLLDHAFPLSVIVLLGTVGYASVGSLFAAMLMRARSREVLLGIVFYPVVIPILLAGTRATQAVLAHPVDLETAWFWARLLLVFDIVFVTTSLWLYEPLVATD